MSNHIKDFWDNQAKKHGISHDASWSDKNAIQLEIDNISSYIQNGDYVLDAGCANGYSAIEQLKKKNILLQGIDFSESMIEQANEAIIKAKDTLGSVIKFQVCDIKKLCFPDNTFDVTYTTRVIINLPTWEEQVQGIKECIRVTKKGGIIILSEAFYEPLQKLNALRLISGLSPLVEHDFNRYIKKEKLELLLNNSFYSESYTYNDFTSLYYLGSRFIRELVTKISDYKGYSNPINEEFYQLENKFSGGGFGIQAAYIIKK